MMAEMTGFPNEMVAEARTLQRTVRECFPLLLESEGDIYVHVHVCVCFYTYMCTQICACTFI